MRFRFHNNSVQFDHWLRFPMDIAVLREIYLDKEYDWCPIVDPKVIIDLGAHFGDTTLYYHTRFPNARIIAVEPAPESYERLLKNTQNIKNIIPVQAAVTDIDGEITLNLMSSSLGNSLSTRSHTTSSVRVPAMTLRTLLDKQQINFVDLLKFDIEGAEFTIFGSPNNTQNIKALIGEVHEDLGGDTIQKFKSLFTERVVETEQLQNKKRFITRIY